jgi:2-polyprenyl-3-methyl-5-hydroxy-6-metoxy-1,4-benzoquinol methylase
MVKTRADFHWPKYTKMYNSQVNEMERNGFEFLVTKFKKEADNISFEDNLHGNWKDIYVTIHRLKPRSIFECGCGGMYHLKNIRTLFPEIKVHGCDLLQSQIDYGAKKFDVPKEILNNVRALDFSNPKITDNLSRYDFVFSHAVMMHLPYKQASAFLSNMIKISSKYVFLIDSRRHDYPNIIKELGESDNWDMSKPQGFAKNPWLLVRRS